LPGSDPIAGERPSSPKAGTFAAAPYDPSAPGTVTPLCKFVFLDGPRDREALPCYEERLRPVTILPPISSVGETDAAPQFPALLIFVLTSTGAARKPHESFRPFVQLSVAFIFQTASQSTMDDGNAVRGQG
jgi:hypothetical protein